MDPYTISADDSAGPDSARVRLWSLRLAVFSLLFGLVFAQWMQPIEMYAGWMSEGNRVIWVLNSVTELDAVTAEVGKPTVSSDRINAHLAGQGEEIDYLLFPYGDFDLWGNPYRCRRNIVCSDGSVVPAGIYSLGEDGTSASQGNDADDISSWHSNPTAFYQSRLNRQLLLSTVTFASVLSIGCYGLVKLTQLSLFRWTRTGHQ